ncbi:MAG TPA: UDP-N-acetylglucosamine--N-acetylmuramyl-(pentapeptide) pyrophosphoryl-undecaprenol N-acetylglucosamine transferase [Gaiellales bacterium]
MTAIVIAAGGTAGHVMPALAVAEELTLRGATVSFAGTPGRVEASLVPQAGYPFDGFRCDGLERRPSLALVRAIGVDAAAPVACARILRRRKADAVFGGGGFVAGPMLAAARALRIPSVLTEADAHLGLANRLSASLARRVFLAFPIEGRDGDRYRVVGRPVARRFFEAERVRARGALGLPQNGFVLAAFGAFAGALRVNLAVADAFGDGSLDGIVLHLSGARDLEEVRARVRAPEDRYRLSATTDRFELVLAAADLCVARAGGSVFELAACGAPAILVPYPYATADHQRLNAEHFERAGAAVVLADADLDATRLRAEVASLQGDPARLAGMSRAMRGEARPEAASAVADELLRLAAERAA